MEKLTLKFLNTEINELENKVNSILQSLSTENEHLDTKKEKLTLKTLNERIESLSQIVTQILDAVESKEIEKIKEYIGMTSTKKFFITSKDTFSNFDQKNLKERIDALKENFENFQIEVRNHTHNSLFGTYIRGEQ